MIVEEMMVDVNADSLVILGDASQVINDLIAQAELRGSGQLETGGFDSFGTQPAVPNANLKTHSLRFSRRL